ncbi:hypothetical protein MAPG_11030 [Magnaporthiopsis poae ATCC 64411]|uniref:Uncharacterized protein n=1 Tax=Magnaporthiopsis poae (strain ATCC 64411 / 73-15) TaxID=644358 RepID=A0A0C4EE65_MAGP6|nr:hypothetical protein MAPG_11030 [Magnaporthiopsis poae ATCC 64411]
MRNMRTDSGTAKIQHSIAQHKRGWQSLSGHQETAGLVHKHETAITSFLVCQFGHFSLICRISYPFVLFPSEQQAPTAYQNIGKEATSARSLPCFSLYPSLRPRLPTGGYLHEASASCVTVKPAGRGQAVGESRQGPPTRLPIWPCKLPIPRARDVRGAAPYLALHHTKSHTDHRFSAASINFVPSALRLDSKALLPWPQERKADPVFGPWLRPRTSAPPARPPLCVPLASCAFSLGSRV